MPAIEIANPDPPGDHGDHKIREGGPVFRRSEAYKLSTFIIGKCDIDVVFLQVKANAQLQLYSLRLDFQSSASAAGAFKSALERKLPHVSKL